MKHRDADIPQYFLTLSTADSSSKIARKNEKDKDIGNTTESTSSNKAVQQPHQSTVVYTVPVSKTHMILLNNTLTFGDVLHDNISFLIFAVFDV